MSTILSRTAITAFATFAIASSAAAQAPVQSDSGASLVAGSVAVSVAAAPAPAPLVAPMVLAMASPALDATVAFRPAHEQVASAVRRRAAYPRSTVLMIVGGALIVTGLVVGGDASSILYLAGAGIGGYGLYLHLQSPDARFTP